VDDSARPGCHVVGRVLVRGLNEPLGRAVVFLEPIDAAPATKALAPVVIRQRVGRFDPDFAVAAVGQPVRFRNDDEIFHGVFSYSPPNPFERRPYPPGESRTVTFRHAGVVVTYSPLHTGMRGVILVVPASHHAVPNALGVFQIGGVPAGRYRLSLWTERQGEASREISLAPGEVARVDLTLTPKS
jgi:plastocyanin